MVRGTVRYTTGSPLGAAGTTPAIGYGVHCLGGRAGGLAGRIHARYPAVYAAYRAACSAGVLVPGTAHLVPAPAGVAVGCGYLACLGVQRVPGHHAARTRWVYDALLDVAPQLRAVDCNTLAVPLLGVGGGAGAGGVRGAIADAAYVAGLDITVYLPAGT